MWFIYASLAGLCFASLALLQRYFMKQEGNNPVTISFFFSLVGTICLVPFVIHQPQFSTSITSWGLMLIVGSMIVANNILMINAMKYADASIISTIGKFKIVWVFLLGMALSYEVWSPYKGLGILFTLIAAIILICKPNSKASYRGISLAFLATLFLAVGIIIYRPLLEEFNILTFTFLIFAIPAVIIFVLMPQRIENIKIHVKQQSWRLLGFGFLGALGNMAMVAAIDNGEASRVLVVMEVMFILVLVGEYVLLKEKKEIITKTSAVISAITGAVLMRIGA